MRHCEYFGFAMLLLLYKPYVRKYTHETMQYTLGQHDGIIYAKMSKFNSLFYAKQIHPGCKKVRGQS